MFSYTPNRWLLNALCAIPVGAGVEMVYKTPSDPLAFAGCSLMAIGTVFIIGNEAHGILSRIERLAGYSILDKNLDSDEITLRQRAQYTAPIKSNGKLEGTVVMDQSVAMPKIDRERELARTLNDMRLGGFKMDISESYWIRAGHWKDSPETFRVTRAKWQHYGIVGKRGDASNSRYEIQNEKAIELIGSGKLHLPPLPQM